jgi:predicted  nucleic acid-binding Zn-ribbon protein
VNAQQRKAWQSQFVTLIEESGQGAVTGEQLKTLLSGSGLPTTTLAQIWALSAKPGAKTLSEEEFMVCCFLVGAAVRGVALPSTLPKELLKSIRKPSKEVGTVLTPPSASPPPAASSPPVTKLKTSKSKTDHSSSPDKPKRSASGTLRSSAGSGGSGGSGGGGVEPTSSASGAGVAGAPGSAKRKSKWALTKEQKRRFVETFSQWSTEGFVDGETAVRLFSQSGLPRQDLASIWALSDIDRDTKLSQQEFCVAMALISRRMQGDALPATVPTALVLSSSSELMSKRAPKGLSRTGQSSGQMRREAPPQRSISMMGPTPTTASGVPSQRASIMVMPSAASGASANAGYGMTGGGFDESAMRGMQRSASSNLRSGPDGNATGMGGFAQSQEDLFAARQPLQTRSVSSVGLGSHGFGGATSYSASELPGHEFGAYGSMRPLAMYGVEERPIADYDATADLVKLEEVNDLSTVQMILARLTEEVRSLGTAYDKAQLQHESLKVKLDATAEQSSITQRRRNNFDTILRNYNQQLDADMGMYNSLKMELNEASSDIDALQQQLNSPQFDLTALRERRRTIQTEFAKVRAQATASHDEHTRLVLEVEKLRAAGAEQAAQINTDWSDHGFTEEPALAFGDGDFATASTSSLPPSAFSPSFTFKPTTAAFGTASGTMTPSIEDWDFNDAASEVGEDVDLAWLKPEFSSPSSATTATTTNGADFFASESTNWANFSVQEDERRRERASSVSKERKPSQKVKVDAKSPSDPEKKKKKTKKDK